MEGQGAVRFLRLGEIAESPASADRWDLLIVGGGPVGLTLARELCGTAIRTLVVESGTRTLDPDMDALNAFENVGAPRIADPARLRARVLGGTSSIWSGRCAPFDAIDFEERPWVANSGWPIDADDVYARHADRAATHLGLAAQPYDGRLWQHLGQPSPDLVADRLKSQFWQYSRHWRHPSGYLHFGLSRLPTGGGNVDVLLGATVTGVRCSGDGRHFAALDLVAADGARRTLRAGTAVLCAGGIENARLLLLLRQAGGSTSDAVGRYLMDHPRCTIGHFDVKQMRNVAGTFGLFRSGKLTVTHGVALSDAMQRSERLLNCAAWLTEVRAGDDPWEAIKRLARRKGAPLRDAASLVGNAPLIVRGLWRYLFKGRAVLHKCDALTLDCLVEQVPDPKNRVTLSERRDRFGTPLARIEWRVGALERATVSRFARIIAAELERIGGPKLELARWIADDDDDAAEMLDVAHPIGSTRMSSDPRCGAVDPNCLVHGMEGIYAAGSSTFPTSGHANPTLMALVLAVRLADHLKTRRGRQATAA